MFHSKYNFIVLLLFLSYTSHSFAEPDILNTGWSLKEGLIDKDHEEPISSHSIKIGYSTKNLNSLSVNGNNRKFSFADQQLNGINFNYDYKLTNKTIETAIYTNIGYYTKYNNLGNQGYADLSALDVYAGFSLGYSFFNRYRLTPKALAGIGNSHYFQRGDVSEVSAEANYLEQEYGLALDFEIPSKDAFPSSWSTSYLLSIRYIEFENISGASSTNGNKVTASFGVQL